MLGPLATFALVSTALIACSKPNPSYCAKAEDCTQPDRSYCDLDGVQGDNRLANTCVPDPQDGSCNAAEPCADGLACRNDEAGVDGYCVECIDETTCPAERPQCDVANNSCTTPSCTPGEEGDAKCVAETPTSPWCGPEERCVECLVTEHCTATDEPVCEDYACRGCQAHTECDSGACDLEQGNCLLPAEIIYVATSGTDGDGCGAAAEPCASFSGVGVLGGALAQVTPNRKTIVAATGQYPELLTIDGIDVVLIGQGQVELRPTIPDVAFGLDVRGAAEVQVFGLLFSKTTDGDGSGAIRCVGQSELYLTDTVAENVAKGIVSSSCDLHLLRSTVRQMSTQGITVSEGSLTMQQSKVLGNARGGLELDNADFFISNSLFAGNGTDGSAGSSTGGISFGDNLGNHSFEFNTIAGNFIDNESSRGSALNCEDAVVGANNLIAEASGGGGVGGLVTGCDLSYSLVVGGYPGAGNIGLAPLFLSSSDYHLQADSPGVDAAEPGSRLDIDIDGDARPQGAGRDMGMDEVPSS